MSFPPPPSPLSPLAQDDDTCSVRATCEVALSEMVAAFGDDAIEAIAAAAAARLDATSAASLNAAAAAAGVDGGGARGTGRPRHWWKSREAALLALGVLDERLLSREAEGRCPLPLLALTEEVLREDCGGGGGGGAGVPPFLRAR